MSYIGSNNMTHENNNIPIKLLNAIEESCDYLEHYSLPFPKGATPRARDNNDSMNDSMCFCN